MKALVKWSAKVVGSILMQIQIAKEVIFHLEVMQSPGLFPQKNCL
jgi:hypothetical protein